MIATRGGSGFYYVVVQLPDLYRNRADAASSKGLKDRVGVMLVEFQRSYNLLLSPSIEESGPTILPSLTDQEIHKSPGFGR